MLTKEWMKGNRVSHITRTASVLMLAAETSPIAAKVSYTICVTGAGRSHWRTGPFNGSGHHNLHPAHAKRIEEIIAENKPPFLFSATNSSPCLAGWIIPAHRGCVRKRSTNWDRGHPRALTEYLNKVLTETDHANPDPESWILPAVAPLPRCRSE